MVAWPRTRMLVLEPGAPDVAMDVTPATRPWKAWSRLVMTEPFIIFSFIEPVEPARSLFFIVP